MKKIEMAKLAMHKTVSQVLDDYAATWNSFIAFSNEVAQLRSLIQGIEGDNLVQAGSHPVGFTNQKSQAFTNMLDLSFTTAMKLKVWAQKQHDEVAYQTVNYSRTGLSRDSEMEIINRCKMILTMAVNNAGSLSDYQVTADSNARLKTAIDVAAALTVNQDVIGSTHRSATSGIEAKLKAASIVLNNLDGLVKGFTDPKDAAFVAAYFEARKATYYHGSPKKAAVKKTPEVVE